MRLPPALPARRSTMPQRDRDRDRRRPGGALRACAPDEPGMTGLASAQASPAPGARAPKQPPMVELINVSMNFVQRGGLADRLARMLGAGAPDQVVHAVDGVSL